MTARKRAMNIIDKALHCSDITFPTPRVINGIPEPAQANVRPLDYVPVENVEPVNQLLMESEALKDQTVAQLLPEPCIAEIERSISPIPIFSVTADDLPSTSSGPDPKVNNSGISNPKKKRKAKLNKQYFDYYLSDEEDFTTIFGGETDSDTYKPTSDSSDSSDSNNSHKTSKGKRKKNNEKDAGNTVSSTDAPGPNIVGENATKQQRKNIKKERQKLKQSGQAYVKHDGSEVSSKEIQPNPCIEQVKIKSELTNISSFRVNIEEKVVAIENEIASLKNSPTSMINTSLLSYEDFVSETQERSQREKNIIIRGIKEIKSSNLEERRSHDGEEVKKVLKMAVSEHMEPTKTIRLGKYNPDISRPIKVIFSTSEAAKLILRNKSNIKSEDIKIYTDETPYQQKYRNNLKDELKRRVAGGEKDITIKYIKGTPKITKIQSKN
ncbi:hypothetical protein PYW07_006725 [Mythimna separata]|uniref:Uncharacterized protein n=1 Tax=Mythimna separata TaxID=271217 RepID=A0AAD7YWD7_MYTSE|nr:hypothetical protein PYW07_006725 [Mythimna separata]